MDLTYKHMLRPPLCPVQRQTTQALRARPADASHSEWTAYHDDLTDLWQILPGLPVLQPGKPSGLQMSNPL